MPERTPSPEQRARQQLRAIRVDLLHSFKDIDTHPEQTAEILSRHRERVAAIVQQGRGQSAAVRRTAWHPPVQRDLPLAINLLWSLLMIAMVITVSWLTGGELWPVLLPLAVWVVVGAFVWTVGVPYLLLVVPFFFAALF